VHILWDSERCVCCTSSPLASSDDGCCAGSIPTHIGQLVRLVDLDLTNNAIAGLLLLSTVNKYTIDAHAGSIPTHIGQLIRLVDLNLTTNAIASLLLLLIVNKCTIYRLTGREIRVESLWRTATVTSSHHH
jgi:hypothetical protein